MARQKFPQNWSTFILVLVSISSVELQFMVIATSACGKLSAAGHWADFVDPSSGRAVSF